MINAAISRIGKAAVDYALPPRCPVCGVTVAESGRFCLSCWNRLSFLGPPMCAGCGIPFAFERVDDALCGQCLIKRPPHDGVRAVTAYDDDSGYIAMRLKYGGQLGLSDLISDHMQRFVTKEDKDSDAIIIPVPLHRWRIWTRGFNQSVLIGRGLCKKTGLTMRTDLLRRTKSTPPLRAMDGRARNKIVRSAFSVHPKADKILKGRQVILVDDVYTSGSTTNACTKALKRAGAVKVTIFVWARVLSGERE